MDRQRIIFEQLMLGQFTSNLAGILFSAWMKKGDVVYSNGSYKVKEPNYSLPDEKLDCFEHDTILMLTHCGERIENGRLRKMIVGRRIISIEIKTTVSDIRNSTVDKYLGATRMFFIAAPKDVLWAVVDKYRNHPRKEMIGIIDSDAGQVVVLPQFQDFQKDRCDRLLARCYDSQHNLPFCCPDTEPFAIHRVMMTEAKIPTWVERRGLRVNSDYLNYYAL